MAGTQYNEARTAGGILKQAKKDLEAASKAPSTGSASRDALSKAQSAFDAAKSNFSTKYGAYVADMRKDDKNARVDSESHFTG
jgi:hypothetical protein